MAKNIFCYGGCGAVSPDPKTGLHEANHWLRVQHATALYFTNQRKSDARMYCKKCGQLVIDALFATQKHEVVKP